MLSIKNSMLSLLVKKATANLDKFFSLATKGMERRRPYITISFATNY